MLMIIIIITDLITAYPLGGSSSVIVLIKFEFRSFCGGKKSGEPREKPLEQGENQQQSYMRQQVRESNLGHRGGRQTMYPEY